MAIQALIDKQDNFEIIRDQIGAILLAETTSQQALATTAGKDPDDWKFYVYLERSNPWEQFIEGDDKTPIVSVWWNGDSVDEASSNSVERRKYSGTFNVDIYGYGVSEDLIAGGHTPGDYAAIIEMQRVSRLVRNILEASVYQYLGIRGTVWKRIIQSRTVFQPQQDGLYVQNIAACRLALSVDYSELASEYTGEAIELISNKVSRQGDGKLILSADYEYPLV